MHYHCKISTFFSHDKFSGVFVSFQILISIRRLVWSICRQIKWHKSITSWDSILLIHEINLFANIPTNERNKSDNNGTKMIFESKDKHQKHQLPQQQHQQHSRFVSNIAFIWCKVFWFQGCFCFLTTSSYMNEIAVTTVNRLLCQRNKSILQIEFESLFVLMNFFFACVKTKKKNTRMS